MNRYSASRLNSHYYHWHIFVSILHTMNRRTELKRLIRWAKYKKLEGPLKLYLTRMIEEDEKLLRYRFRHPGRTYGPLEHRRSLSFQKHGGDERLAEHEARQRRRRDRAQPLELDVAHQHGGCATRQAHGPLGLGDELLPQHGTAERQQGG